MCQGVPQAVTYIGTTFETTFYRHVSKCTCMSSPYKHDSLAHQERCSQLLLMHSSASPCILCCFDSHHAKHFEIMHAAVLENQRAQQCNDMYAVVLECDSEQSSCTKLHCSLDNHYAKTLCKQQQQQKTAGPPLKWVTESRRLSRTVLSRTTLWAWMWSTWVTSASVALVAVAVRASTQRHRTFCSSI